MKLTDRRGKDFWGEVKERLFVGAILGFAVGGAFGFFLTLAGLHDWVGWAIGVPAAAVILWSLLWE